MGKPKHTLPTGRLSSGKVTRSMRRTIGEAERTDGGHVGSYVGEDAEAYHVLRSNRGDGVSVARVARDRCLTQRWPEGRLVVGGQVRVAEARAGPMSRNEA